MRTEASVGIKNFTWALCSLELTGGGACCHLHVIYARRYHALGRRRWRSGRGPACQCRRRRRHEFSPWSEDLLEEGTATHSSIPARIIPWTEEPVGYRPCTWPNRAFHWPSESQLWLLPFHFQFCLLTEPHSASDHFAIGFCSSWDSIPACPDVLTQNYPLFASGFGKLAKILKKKRGGGRSEVTCTKVL